MRVKICTRKMNEYFSTAACSEPASGQRHLYTLHSPEMIEQFEILDHGVWIKNGIEWRIDLVDQSEDIPTNFASSVLQHFGVEAAKDFGRVILSVGRAHCGLESSREIMAVESIGRLR